MNPKQDRKAPAKGAVDHPTVSFVEQPTDTKRDSSPSADQTSLPLPAIPGYEILGELGRGGMGVVYKARHLELNRLVALKMIRNLDVVSPEELDRFRGEAEAVAALSHPNIVQIHEIGSWQGMPYFTLEYCPAGSLMGRRNLTTRQAAELVESIARAVAHAHAQGIVHRDLKPANILLAEDSTPKVCDFGLAKNVKLDAGKTVTGTIMGTPDYMAPEQASGQASRIGPTTDIWALGVILYQLLTARTPFQADSTMQVLLNVINEAPAPPSSLNRAAPRDLEVIVLKCLHKEPQARYVSADALADDIRRWLDGHPIEARPVGKAERCWKWFKRNPAAALVAVVLAIATPVSMTAAVMAVQARDAEAIQRRLAENNSRLAENNAKRAEANARQAEANAERAEENERIAERERDSAIEVRDFLRFEILQQADSQQQANRLLDMGIVDGTVSPNLTLRDALDRAAEGLSEERIDERFPDRPLLQAAILQTVGDTYSGLGEYETAVQFLERARAIQMRELGTDHIDTIRAQFKLAAALKYSGRYAEAVPLYEQTLNASARTLGDNAHDTINLRVSLAGAYAEAGQLQLAIPMWELALEQSVAELGDDHTDTLNCRNNLAWAYQEIGRLDQAIPMFERVLEQSENALGKQHPDTLVSVQNLALALHADGRSSEAIPLLESALPGFTASLGEDHPRTLACRNSLAYVYAGDGRLEDALPLWEVTLQQRESKLGLDHPETLTSRNNLAAGYFRAGQPDKAAPLMEQTLKLREKQLGEDHPHTILSRTNLAVILRQAGRAEEALPHYKRALEQTETRQNPDHADTLTAAYNLAGGYESVGELDKAIAQYERAYQGMKSMQFDHPNALVTLWNLGVAYGKIDELEKQENIFRERLALLRSMETHDALSIAATLTRIGDSLLKQNKFAEAEELLREGVSGFEEAAPESWQTIRAISLLGEALLKREQYDQAEPLLLSSHADLKDLFARADTPDDPGGLPPADFRTACLRISAERLVDFYKATGNPEEVDKWQKERDAQQPNE